MIRFYKLCGIFFIVSNFIQAREIPSLSLIPLPSESGIGIVQIRPLKTQNIGVMEVGGGSKVKAYYIVTIEPRNNGGFNLKSVDDGRVVLIKGNQKVLVKGSLVNTFELNLSGDSKTILIAQPLVKGAIEDHFISDEFPGNANWDVGLEVLKRGCGKDFIFDWSEKLSSKLKNRSFNILKAFEDLCVQDSDYREAIQKINRVSILPGKNKMPKISKKSRGLTLELSEHPYGLKRFVIMWLKENL
ncbi:MAG: hypothetical protein K9K67_14960 [Bacteriovoracaceae bacterium]|nr:hypothetical protein [Bacteriovoracaceae bacterium]